MPFELVYSSAQKGLMPGSRGFCVIAATRGIPSDLVRRLESLSGYRHLFAPSDPRNPVLYHFVRLRVGHQEYYVLSKIRDAGFDYSGRSNKLAHHVALSRDELVEIGPAEVLYHWDTFFPWTENQVGYLEDRRIVFNGVTTPSCEVPGGVVTDLGWVEYFAAATAALSPQQSLSFIYPAGWQPLELIRQIWRRLPAGSRWELTFSTWSPLLPGHISCNVRFVCDGTSEAGDLRRNAQMLFWDLTAPLGQAPEPLKIGGGPNVSSEPVCDLPMGLSIDLKPSRPTGFTLEEPVARSVFRSVRSLPPTSYQDAMSGGHRHVVPPVVPTDSPTAIPVGTGDVPLSGMVLPPAATIAPPAAVTPMDTSSGSIWFYTSILVGPTLAVVLGVLAWILVSSYPGSERTVAKGGSASNPSTKQNNLPDGSGQQGPESQKLDKSEQIAQPEGGQKMSKNQKDTTEVPSDATNGKQSATNGRGSDGSTGSKQNEHSNSQRSNENGQGRNRSDTDRRRNPQDPQGREKNDLEGNFRKIEGSSGNTSTQSQDSKERAPKSPLTASSSFENSSQPKSPDGGGSSVAKDSFTWFGGSPEIRQAIDKQKEIDERIVSPPENPSQPQRFDKLFRDYKSLGTGGGFVVDLSSKSSLRELDKNSVQPRDLESVCKENAILWVCKYFEQHGEKKLVWFGLVVPKDYWRPGGDASSNQTCQSATSANSNSNFIRGTEVSVSLPNYEERFKELVNRFAVKVNTGPLARGPSKLSGKHDGDNLTLEYDGHQCIVSVHKHETQISVQFKPVHNVGDMLTNNGGQAASNSDSEFHKLLGQCTFYLYVEFKWKEHKDARDDNPTDKATWFAVPIKLGGN